MTHADGKLEVARNLLSFAARINNTSDVLGEIYTVLNDSTSTKKDKRMKLNLISKTMIPLLVSISTKIKVSAELLSPIGGIGYVHTRIETKRKREIIATNSPASESEQYICHFVHNIGEPSPKQRRATHSVSPIMEDDSPPPLPVPAKGEGCGYNKAEVIAILLQFNRRSVQYMTQKFAIIAHQKEVNCPCSERTIQRLIERHDKGLPIDGEFTSVGKTSILYR